MIHLELQPETEAQLAAEAQARGLAIDRYIEKIVESRPAEQPISQQKTHSISKAIDRILELREDSGLGGLSIRRPHQRRPQALMATFVIDASATLPWCLRDEESAWTISLLLRLSTGDSIILPAHWPTEVSNGLLMATRRKRIPAGRASLFWDELAILPITVEPALTPTQANPHLSFAINTD